MSDQRLVERLRRGLPRRKIKALTGRLNDDGSYTVPSDEAGYVWVRVIGDENNPIEVLNLRTGADQLHNLTVWLQYNEDSELEIESVGKSDQYVENIVAQHYNAPRQIAELRTDVLRNDLLKGLRCRIHADGGLKIYVEPGLYDYNGTIKWFEGEALDLTTPVDYRPGTANQKIATLITINAGNALEVVQAGTAVSIAATAFTYSDYLAITTDYVLDAGISLSNGLTAFANGQADILDLRVFNRSNNFNPADAILRLATGGTDNKITGQDGYSSLIVEGVDGGSFPDYPFFRIGFVDELTYIMAIYQKGDVQLANLYWDASTARMGVGTTSPGVFFDINGVTRATTYQLPASSELTIATGAITITQSYHTIDTESDASTDDLTSITITENQVCYVRAADGGRTVVIKNGANVLTSTGSDITLDEDYKFAIIIGSSGGKARVIDCTGGGGATAGANAALSNLSGVAINTTLVSDTDNTDDLGSASVKWRAAYTNLLVVEERSAPSTPASGDGALYASSSDGHLYYKDDAGTEYDLITGSGLSTAGTTFNPHAKPASAEATYSDEFSDSSLDGKWTEYDPDGALTVTEDARGLVFSHASNGTVRKWRGIYQAAPANDFTIYAYVALANITSTLTNVGLCLWDDATDNNADLIAILLGVESSRWAAVWRNTAYNGTVSVPASTVTLPIGFAWLRIRYTHSSTTWYFDSSTNGVIYRQIYTITNGTLGYTPSQFGLICCDLNNIASTTMYHHVGYFRYTNSNVGESGISGGQRVKHVV